MQDRLKWEQDYDCIAKMRSWILDFELEDGDGEVLKFVSSEEELIELEKEAKKHVSSAKRECMECLLK